MKKLLLFMALLFLQSSINAQTIFSEDFDGISGPTAGGAGTYVFPSGWLLRNVDNRTPAANVGYVNDAWERREDFSFNVLDSSMFSTSWYSPVGIANDWAWTPVIGPLPPNSKLKWNAVAYDSMYPDGYEVRIMVAPNVPTGGSGDIGNQITQSTVLFSTIAENSSWTSREVPLSAYAGQSVYIAFRNNSNDKFLLLIDDVEVFISASNDVSMQSSDTITPYSQIPLLMTSPLSFGGDIINNGVNAATNVSMTTTVFNESNSQVFTSQSNVIPSLASGATGNVNAIDTYLPTLPGTYTVRYVANMTATDENHSNDTIYDSFVISDSTFSRTRGDVVASLGIGAGNGGYLGNHYTAPNNGQLTSVSVRMAETFHNMKFGVAIWDFASGSPNTIIYQSPIGTYPAHGDSTYIFPVNIPITAGQSFLVSAIEVDSTLAVAQTTDIFTLGSTWVDWPTNPIPGWANNEDFGVNFRKPYAIKAHFSACEEIPDVTATPLSQSLCSGESTQIITFTGSIPGTVFHWTNNNPSIGLAASGTGNIPSFVAENNIGGPLVAEILVTPVIDEICAGSPVQLTITVNSPSTIIATPLDQDVCSGDEMEEIVISSIPSGPFTWTRDNLTEVTGINASGNDNITGIPVNTTDGPVTLNFTITPTSGQCGSEPYIVTLDVNIVRTVDPIQDLTVCSGNIVSETVITGNDPEAEYSWTNDNPGIGLAASGTGNIPQFTAVNTGSNPVTANITITPSNGGNGNSGTLVPEVLYYKFNTPGPTVPNLASNPPAGTANATIQGGLTITETDLCETALTGTGNSSGSDYLNTGWAPNLTGSWTISVKTSNFAPSSLLYYIFGDANTTSWRCFTNGVAGPNNWVLRGPVTDVYINGGATIAPHTITFVYDAPLNEVRGYLDGTLVTTVSQGAVIINGAGPFKVMGYATNIGAPAGGQLDDFRLYSRALSSEEVLTLNGCLTEGCGVESFTYAVTVNPGSDILITPSEQSICTGEQIEDINITSSESGYSSTWTRDNTTNLTGMPISGSGNIISGSLVNTTLTEQIAIFTITTTNGICTYENQVSVSVSPIYEIDPIANIVVCNGTSISEIDITSNNPDGQYQWSNDNTNIGLGSNGTGDIPSFTAINTGVTPIVANIQVSPVSGESDTQTFNFTGSLQTYTVPENVYSLYVEAYGAEGADGQTGSSEAAGGTGGLGSKTAGYVNVVPGQVLNLYVGGAGSGQTGGYNGGGNGGTQQAGGGGGSTDIRINGTNDSDRIITAGGGGGGGRGGCEENGAVGGIGGAGGAGGSGIGLNGADTPTNGGFAGGGQGGNFGNIQGALGEAGIGCGGFLGFNGLATSNSQGAEGGGGQECCCFSSPLTPGGGGGGGGQIGGGGGGGGSAGTSGCSGNSKGAGGGGGGGSSYIGGVSSGIVTAGVNEGNGYIVISYQNSGDCSEEPVNFTITVNPTPTTTVSTPSQTICSGSAISTINLTGPVSGTVFNWTRDNNASVTGIAASGSGDIFGTMINTTGAPVLVTFTITPVANGCNGPTATATVLVNPAVSIIATPANQSICSGNPITTIVLSGSIPGNTYTWTRDNTASVTGIPASGTGDISGTLTNTTSAPITVTFSINTTANGCNATLVTATVVVNPTPNAVATPQTQTICSAGTITTIALTGAVVGTTFNWTRDNTAAVTGIAASGNGNITGALTNTTNAPITVVFTITPTANGCQGSAITATVIVNPAPILTVTPVTQTVCSGVPITTIVPGGGLPGSVYNWTRDNNLTVTGIGASGNGNVSGTLENLTTLPVTVTFTFSATTGGCASIPVTATVIVNPRPNATISLTPNPVCVGSTLLLSATGGANYSWSGPQGWASTLQNPSIFVVNHLQAGVYSVTVTNASGCSVVLSDTLTVYYPPVAEASYELSTACVGSDLQLHGSGAGSYLWTGPGGWTSTVQHPVIEDVTAANSGQYTFTVTSPNGCTAEYILNIVINELPSLQASPKITQTCEGSRIQLFASGIGSFAWSGPATYYSTEQNPWIVNIPMHMTGQYVVTLTAATGCEAMDTVRVIVYDQVYVNATATPDTVCEGQSLQLHADGGSTYLWVGPAGFISYESDPRIDNITRAHAGKYYVYVYNEGGCFGYAEVNVVVNPSAKGSAYASPSPADEYSTVQFFASDGVSHRWTGPLGFTSTLQNPFIKSVTRHMAGIYTVTIMNENGCPTIIKVALKVNFTNKGGNFGTTNEDELTTRTKVEGTVYPNPTNGFLYFETQSKGPVEYIIYDLNGNIQQQLKTSNTNYISTDKLSSGIYQIRWKPTDSDEWLISKFAKVN